MLKFKKKVLPVNSEVLVHLKNIESAALREYPYHKKNIESPALPISQKNIEQ